MNKFLLAAVAVFAAGAAYAGGSVSYEPVVPQMDNDSDMTGALVMLALVGVVIASSMISGAVATKREADPFLLPNDDDSGS